MKKLIALLLVLVMAVAMVACNANTNTTAGNNGTTAGNNEPTGGNNEPTGGNTENVEPAKGADEMLNAAVDKFAGIMAPLFEMSAEDVKNFFGGGYFSEDETTIKAGAAGKTPIDVEDAVLNFKMISLITDDAFAKLDDAAVFHHGMNINTLAVSSMKVADAANVESVANSLKNSVGGNEIWQCGFPERYFVITIDSYVISAYGNADMVNAMKTAITETYANAVVVADEAFA